MKNKIFLTLLLVLAVILLPLAIKFFQASAQQTAAGYCVFIDPKKDLICFETQDPVPPETCETLAYVDIIESQAWLNNLTLDFEVKLNGILNISSFYTLWTIMIDRNNNPYDNCPDYPTEDVDTMYSVIYNSSTMEWRMEKAVYGPSGWQVNQTTEATYQIEANVIQIMIPIWELEPLPKKLPWKVKTELLVTIPFLIVIGDIAPNERRYYWPPTELEEYMVDSWPQFRRNWAHTAFINFFENNPPLDNKTTFVRSIPFANEDNTLASSPIVGDGMVFVATTNGMIYAYDAVTGATRWSFQIEHGTFSTPALSSGLLYVAGYDNKTYVLDAETGSLVRTHPFDDIIVSSITYQCGEIFFVSSLYGNLNAFTPGLEELLWKRYIDGGTTSTPAVGAGLIFVGSLNNQTYALDKSDGSMVWNCSTNGPIYSSPTYYNGTVFVGSFDEHLYALNASIGSPEWSFKTGGPIVSSPATASKQDLNWTSDLVFVGSGDGKIYSIFAENGTLNWAFQTQGNISFSSPALASYWQTPTNKRTILYIGSMDRYVYALDAITGNLVWKYETGGEVVSSPAIAYDRVYINSLDGCLYVFGPPDPIEDHRSANVTQGYELTTIVAIISIAVAVLILRYGFKKKPSIITGILLVIIITEAGFSAMLVPKAYADLRKVQTVTPILFHEGVEASVGEDYGSRKSVYLSWEGRAEAGINMESSFISRFNAYWGRTDQNSLQQDWPNQTTSLVLEFKPETPYLYAGIYFESDFKVKDHELFDVEWSKTWNYTLKGLIGEYDYKLIEGKLTELEFSLWIIGVKISVPYKLFISTGGVMTGEISTDGPYIPDNISCNPQHLTWNDQENLNQTVTLGPVYGPVPIPDFDGEVYLNLADGIEINKLKLKLEIWVKIKLCFVELIKADVKTFKLCTISLDFLDLLGVDSILIPASCTRFVVAEYPFLTGGGPPIPGEKIKGAGKYHTFLLK